MQESQESQTSSSVHSFYHQTMQQIEPYHLSTFEVSNDDSTHSRRQATEFPFQTYAEQFFTLESTPVSDYAVYNSPSTPGVSSNMSPFSPQYFQSYASDLHHASDNPYGSPMSGSSGVDDENKLMHALWVLRNELLGPECDIDSNDSLNGIVTQASPFTRYNRILEMAPHMDLKQLLLACAKIVSEADTISLSERRVAVSAAEALMDIIEKRVSISGGPIERLGAYMLEGLRARILSSGSIIYKKLKCKEPTSSELMSYMHMLSQICPYYKFAYMSANVVIGEAMENENRIHIIDFQIAQGSHSCTRRRLQIVGQRLAQVAESCGVPFEFHGAAISGCEVQLENLQVRHGEALAVNFPYILHHMPDESVSTTNHRDRLLRMVKSLSPKIVTLVEQESNTNTGTFFQRFCETLDYYTAMFESIDTSCPRDDKQRINAEEHCVARDVVNIIACEGNDREERHELFGKWRLRFTMAGFSPVPLSSSVSYTIRDMLKEHSPDYRVAESSGALYLGWKNRALATSSAWR
ncbi:UNVERIFIED_CONTAM: Scarecrow-like protein 13 [Sesamum angustifolium]|uniref:Scarecrow-like protein 13 n=1 Tax=Sesamum angustifolium TaxID=2727405 RepID=A0AAW2KWZ5_9LAMI